MNDKEAQTTDDATVSVTDGATGNAIGQAGSGAGGAQPVANDIVSVSVSDAEAAVEATVPATEPTETSIAADEPATESTTGFVNEFAAGTVAETAWTSSDALPGAIFVARREELRWSLDEAATRLKLTTRQVSALEADDYASLPGMASVRGFVRSYAKALGLDPEPLLEMLVREPNPAHGPMVLRRPLPTKGFPGRPASPPPRKSKWRKRIMLAVTLLVAGFAAGVEAYRSQWVQLPSLDDLNLSLSLPDPGMIFGPSGSVSPAEGSGQTADDGDHTAGPDSMAENPRAAQPTAAKPALQLRLSEDAWIEITTVSGQRIVSQLIKGGSTASFDIPEPSVLVVGNASAVEARLRGQLLNLKAVARDNVSKLSIK